jgi:hypothetical protein
MEEENVISSCITIIAYFFKNQGKRRGQLITPLLTGGIITPFAERSELA